MSKSRGDVFSDTKGNAISEPSWYEAWYAMKFDLSAFWKRFESCKPPEAQKVKVFDLFSRPTKGAKPLL